MAHASGTFQALGVPAYRRVWTAVLLSSFGSWMVITGRAYLVYDVTGSTSALGTVYLVSYGPQLFLAPYVGALADRYDRRQLVMWGTWGMVMTSVLTGVLAATGMADLRNLCAVSFVSGLLLTVTSTASLALMPALVGPEALSSAISLQAVTNSSARVVGPLLSGALIPLIGVEWLFYLNGALLLPVVFAWSRTTLTASTAPASQAGTIGVVLDGLRFTARTPTIAVPLVLLTVLSGVGLVYQSLGVAYTTDVLAGGQRDLGATYLGAVQAAIGLGSVVGVLGLTALSTTQPARVLLGTSVVFSLALVGLGSTSQVGVAVALGAVIGATQFTGSNVTMALAQHHSPEEMRGRVTSLSMVAFVGVFPFTSFAFGYLADAVGTRATFVGCGAACLVVSLAAIRWAGSMRMPEPVAPTLAA